ncbi:MAG: DUF2344 domain-containing protein [Spirochaetales bacterium]|nr:DUF2344 domain-containing protein [Spirochaetales bacterium]
MNIDPVAALGASLLEVRKPSRYLGGEYGATRKGEGTWLDIALCFPDLYEIGTSNNAVRILYSALNALEGVRCERVFAPAPDFEALLTRSGVPLYTLETGLPVAECDLVAFSIGYELSITGVLTVLSSAGIPLRAAERGRDDPIVIAGGPAITNPAPFSPFVDAVWIGEAEAGFFSLASELSGMKKAGARRPELLARIAGERAFWMPGKKAIRAIDDGFPTRRYDTALPVPSLKPVQDHGVVEIMRGCPNGCRFCHAGYFYRPQRVREPEAIFEDVERLVTKGGHREITVSSLSSGDYPRVDLLLRALNARYGPRKVSFQLPSLKVDSFPLPIIEEIAQTRKSGLTFAVETPADHWQLSINKTVTFDRIVGILDEAKRRGYRQAKFYFMLGLPVPGGAGEGEAEALVEYVRRLLAASTFQLNINVGTFVPKAHTPYQWAPALAAGEASVRLAVIREAFRRERRVKLSWHDPFLSALEGVFSRGDARAGDFALDAWRLGCRLDAWEEHSRRDLWLEAARVSAERGYDPWADAARPRSLDESLPWDDVNLRVSRKWLLRELERSDASILTGMCTDSCADLCGSCSTGAGVVVKNIHSEFLEYIIAQGPSSSSEPLAPVGQRPQAANEGRMAFTWRRAGRTPFWPHHQFHDAFHRAFLIADLPVALSEGFNPLSRLELSDPLPIGVSSLEELGLAVLERRMEADDFIARLSACLPEGIEVDRAVWVPFVDGRKRRSLASLAWGSDWEFACESAEGALAIAARLSGEIAVPELQGSLVDAKGPSVRLRLRNGGRKELGLQAILERALGVDPGRSLRLKRTRQFADDGTGPEDYLKVLSLLA